MPDLIHLLAKAEDERDAAIADLAVNTRMLARQCDLARQAENERDAAIARAKKAERRVAEWKERARKARAKVRRVRKLQLAWRHDHSDDCRANRHPRQWGDCDCGSFEVWHALDAALADEPKKKVEP